MSEPVQLAIVAGLFTLAGSVAAGFFAIWKLTVETRANTKAADAAVTATHANRASLNEAAAKLDAVHELLTPDAGQASLKSEVALLRAEVAVAISGTKNGDAPSHN